MATADQVKSLVKAYIDQDNDKFKTVVLQIAAHEARLGHSTIAQDLKKMTDSMGNKRTGIIKMNVTNPMLQYSSPDVRLKELIVAKTINEKINRIITEYRNRKKLYSFGLSNRRKILVEGAPGTGKTMTAAVIATELDVPLYTVQVDKLVTKFMGETSSRLRQIFDSMETMPGVYLFDEFDAIGADRSLDNEVGEMRRILNAFLQFIEQDVSGSIIIAATNNQKMLDLALFRRFDDVLHYELPGENEIRNLFECKFDAFGKKIRITDEVIDSAKGLSQAEITKVCDEVIKESILFDSAINIGGIISLLHERHGIYASKEA